MTTDTFIKQASTDRLIDLLCNKEDGHRTVPECKLKISRAQLIRELASRHVLLSSTIK